MIPYFDVPVYSLGPIDIDPWGTLVCIGFILGLELARARGIRTGLDVATFYDPEVDRDRREFEQDDFWDEGTDKFYKRMGMGGVWAWWPSQAGWAAGQPGTVEYIAAGNGFGPDILEAAADLFERSLVLGKGWSPTIALFKRYGGAVAPKGDFRFLPVQRPDARLYSGMFAVKTAASDAYNSRDYSEGILPRYQTDENRSVEDPAKLAADEQR